MTCKNLFLVFKNKSINKINKKKSLFTFWRFFGEMRNNSLPEGSFIHDFIYIKAAKVWFFGFPQKFLTEASLNFIIFPVCLTFILSLTYSYNWPLHNSIMEFFSHERSFVCTNVFFSDRCMFIDDAKDWILKQT